MKLVSTRYGFVSLLDEFRGLWLLSLKWKVAVRALMHEMVNNHTCVMICKIHG